MIGFLLKALALNEVRLRMRRVSTIVAVLAVVAISWAMIVDPAGGEALIVVGSARVLYTSSALALGSASLASILFGLGGFYLVRGRIAEDIRTGAGSVIGATPVGNALFLAGRWLGAVAYLGLLCSPSWAPSWCAMPFAATGRSSRWSTCRAIAWSCCRWCFSRPAARSCSTAGRR